MRGWLAKAIPASRGPKWSCENCGHVHATWQPVCEHCDSFDTLAWAEAPQSESAFGGTAQMLPLIVGALEDRRDDPEIAQEEPEIVEAEPVEDPASDASQAMAEEDDPHAPGHVLPDMGEVSDDVETSEPARTAAN